MGFDWPKQKIRKDHAFPQNRSHKFSDLKHYITIKKNDIEQKAMAEKVQKAK